MFSLLVIALGLPALSLGAPSTTLCYDCNTGYHTGASSWVNPYCMGNGTIDTSVHPAAPCDGFCFTKTGKDEKGAVYRGCSTGHWYGEGYTITAGCYDVQEKAFYVCFCDTNECNTDDFTTKATEYFNM